jgi:hypothetical protein
MFNSVQEGEMMMVVSYFIYLLISIALIVWVARTLHKRAAILLMDAFHGNAGLAASVNHLLVVGFYLINIGFVSLALKSDLVVDNWRKAIEMLSEKLGWVLLILGAMHFFNLFVLAKNRHAISFWPAGSHPDEITNELRKEPLEPCQLEGTISDYLR